MEQRSTCSPSNFQSALSNDDRLDFVPTKAVSGSWMAVGLGCFRGPPVFQVRGPANPPSTSASPGGRDETRPDEPRRGKPRGASQRMSPADGQMGNAFRPKQPPTFLHRHSMPVDKLISSQLFTESRKPILQLPTSPSGTGIILTAAVPPRHSSHTLAHTILDTRLDCVATLGMPG